MFQPTTFAQELLSAAENHESVHLVSKNTDLPALDSVVYDPRHGITDIQITTKKDHHWSQTGPRLLFSDPPFCTGTGHSYL